MEKRQILLMHNFTQMKRTSMCMHMYCSSNISRISRVICHLQILCTPFHSNQCVTLDKLKTFEFQIHVSTP